jgi:uncharacterized protein (TIGR02284 family)
LAGDRKLERDAAMTSQDDTRIDMDDALDILKDLHTNAIDAVSGYREAASDAEGRGMTGLFDAMIRLHEGHAEALAAVLREHGETADDDGSFMGTVHQAIMKVRSLFDGLDASVLPGLIDGETRNLNAYGDALRQTALPSAWRSLLQQQSDDLQRAIEAMRAERSATSA